MTSSGTFQLSSTRIQHISFWLAKVSTLTCLAFVGLAIVAQLSAFLAFFSFYAFVYGVIWWRNQASLHEGNAFLLFIAIDSGILLLSLLISSDPVLAPMYMLLLAFPFFYFTGDNLRSVLVIASVPLATYALQLFIQSQWLTEPLQPMPEWITLLSVIGLNVIAFGCAMMLFYQFSLNRAETIRLTNKVSAQAKTYDLLDRAWQESERISQEKNKLLMTIGHELRTPLTGIIGNLDLINDDGISPAQQPYWGQVKRSAKVLTGILDDVLEFGQFYNGSHQVDKQSVDVAALINELFVEHQRDSKAKQITLAYGGPQQLHIVTDAVKLRRILGHLINNAIKFNKPEAKRSFVTLNALIDQQQLKLSIADQGIGIAQEKLETIFDSFAQLESDMSRRYQGAGLGLYLSRQLSLLLGGQLTVESELHVGSTFKLTLPLVEASLAPKQDNLRPKPNKALIVEDNPVNRKVLSAMLDKLNIANESAENGQQAVDMYLACDPDLVLMDLQMPVMDGLQATKEIREQEAKHQRTPSRIIAVSANATQHDQLQAAGAGVDDFLIKPYRLSSLKDILLGQAPLGSL